MSPLRAYWHPVAQADQISDSPIGTRLLGEDLVVFRSNGRISAFSDLCVHRGTRLSLGLVTEDGCLQCPYHGWTYDADGKCVRIPSQPADEQRIPSKARAVSYRTEQRYGLVWVALDDPKLPIPEFPEFDDADYQTYVRHYSDWHSSAARWAENGFDAAHLPYVHTGLLCDPDRPEVDVQDLAIGDYGFEYIYNMPAIGAESFANEGDDVRIRFRLDFPFTVTIDMNASHGRTALILPTQPIDANLMSFWLLEARNHSHDVPDATFADYNSDLIVQDRRIVESQRPDMVPVDLTEELHVKGADAPSIEYRRMLEEIGLEFA